MRIFCGLAHGDAALRGQGGDPLAESDRRPVAQLAPGLADVVAAVAGDQAHAVAGEGGGRGLTPQPGPGLHQRGDGESDGEGQRAARRRHAERGGQETEDLGGGDLLAVGEVVDLPGRGRDAGGQEHPLGQVLDVGEADAVAPAVDQDHPPAAQQRGEARQERGVARAPDHPRPHHHRLQAVLPVRPAHQLLAGDLAGGVGVGGPRGQRRLLVDARAVARQAQHGQRAHVDQAAHAAAPAGGDHARRAVDVGLPEFVGGPQSPTRPAVWKTSCCPAAARASESSSARSPVTISMPRAARRETSLVGRARARTA